MGLFEKKYCDICGNKIGLMGNRKLEDGNLCKDCAAKLSPWFSDRRHADVSQIKQQLEYRENNREEAGRFHVTRSLGKQKKLLIDEDQRKFTITSARDLTEANPDILSYDQVTGCDLDINETKTELKRKNDEGKMVSYYPPRFEFSYNFNIVIQVNHPYFDEMRFAVNSSPVKTGEVSMSGTKGGRFIKESERYSADYQEHLEMSSEIRDTVLAMRQSVREEIEEKNAPKMAVTCPACGASTIPTANGCCEYCGSALGQG